MTPRDSDTGVIPGSTPVRGVILAAGLGKRLRPLTIERAKPAVPFLNHPLIEYSLDLFQRSGIQEIAVNLHHAPESVVRAVDRYLVRQGGRAPRLRFSEEKEILGTAGALAPLRSFLRGAILVVSNGKIYFEEETLGPLLDFHRASGNEVSMVLVERDPNEPFTPVWLSAEGRIAGFDREPPEPGCRAYTFTGVQMLSERVLDLIPDRPFDTVRELYPRIRGQGGTIGGWVSHAYWCECSVPSRYLRKSFEVLNRRGQKCLAEGPLPEFRGEAILGPGVELGPDCELVRTVIWANTRIGAGSRLQSVIISGDLEVPAGTRLQDAVITPRLQNLPDSLAFEGQSSDEFVIWPLR